MISAAVREVRVREWGCLDSVQELTRLLHCAYARLARLGLRYMATHQSVEVTQDRIRNGTCLIAQTEGKLVGTLTYYAPSVDSLSPWLARPDVAHFGQLAVLPPFQHQGIGRRLIALAEQRARADRASEIALDTAETARHLIEWYRRLGYRTVERVNWEETNYISVVMSKRL